MENASKALLIAGEVLIAILVASMFALLFSTVSNYAKEYDNQRQTQEIQAFNTQFTNYIKVTEAGIGDSTVQDAISVLNLAKYYNEKNDMNIQVEVKANGETLNQTASDAEKEKLMKIYANAESLGGNSYGDFRFKGSIVGHDESGRINSIRFDLNTSKSNVWIKT